MSEEEEGQIAKQKKLQEDKKRTVSYLKALIEETDLVFAKNFAKGNFSLAAHDARKIASMLDVLSNIDLTQ